MAHEELIPLKYTLSEEFSDEKCVEALELNIREVLGECPTVAVGKLYVVRGDYVANDRLIGRLCVSCHGRSRGQPTPIWQGSRDFEVTAVPMDVPAGKEKVLDLLVFGQSGNELGVRVRLELEGK